MPFCLLFARRGRASLNSPSRPFLLMISLARTRLPRIWCLPVQLVGSGPRWRGRGAFGSGGRGRNSAEIPPAAIWSLSTPPTAPIAPSTPIPTPSPVAIIPATWDFLPPFPTPASLPYLVSSPSRGTYASPYSAMCLYRWSCLCPSVLPPNHFKHSM